jgi:hypothetical protein
MPRWRWHLTRTGEPDELAGLVGLASNYGSQSGAYSRDYVDHATLSAKPAPAISQAGPRPVERVAVRLHADWVDSLHAKGVTEVRVKPGGENCPAGRPEGSEQTRTYWRSMAHAELGSCTDRESADRGGARGSAA